MVKEMILADDFINNENSYLEGKTTLEEVFKLTLQNHKKNTAITYINEKDKIVSYNYKKFGSYCYEKASKLSQQLKNIPQGSIIGLKIKNSPEWLILFYSILMNGYRPLLIDAKLAKENTENLLKQSKASAIITPEIFNYSILNINIDSLEMSKSNSHFKENWENHVIFCSSGTTGQIKLSEFSGKNLINQIISSKNIGKVSQDVFYKEEINILTMIPLHHIFSFASTFLWYQYYGKNLVFLSDLSTTNILKTCQRCNVTHLFSVPLFWDSLAKNIERKCKLSSDNNSKILVQIINGEIKEDSFTNEHKKLIENLQNDLLGTKIRFAISGGGYISQKTLQIINNIGYPLVNGYGMTEIGIVSVELSSNKENRLKGSIGKPFYGVTFKIDSTSSKTNTGELLVKSEIIHQNDIINGERVEPQLEDGFFKTGDIVEKDSDGNFYIKGRIKDVIINENGENIFPDELEYYFNNIKGISNLCALGVKKETSNKEIITLIIELNSDVDDEKLKQIKKECDEINLTLQNEKKIEEFLIYKNKLPITATSKVKRSELKNMLASDKNSFLPFDFNKPVHVFSNFKKEEVEKVVLVLRKIFSKVLLLPIVSIDDDAHWINDLGGDSMNYIELLNEIKKEFNVEISTEKYGKLATLNDFALEILTLKQKMN